MKYGESIFDIFYLLFAIANSLIILFKYKNKHSKLIGYSILILGLGDAFHLVPRIINYFINYNFNIYLGIGKLITSITMTIFYIFLYYIYLKNYKIKENKNITSFIWLLSIIRIILCLLPQNNWFTNESPYIWGIIRNIPFLIIGIIITILYYNNKNKDKIWLYVVLSFVFYLIVVLFANKIPILGMFMLPKTICYILIIISLKKKCHN